MHIQHVLTENFDLQKLSSSIKIINTFNCRETVQKREMKLPDILYKVILGDIIRRGAIYFIYNLKYGHQDEEEDSKNDVSVLSSN